MNNTQEPIPPPVAHRHCYRVSELVSQQRDGKLTMAQKSFVYTHLLVCKSCRNFSKNTHILSSMIQAYKKRADKI